MIENPAVLTYRYYREAFRFHGESRLVHLRERAALHAAANSTAQSPMTVEEWTLSSEAWVKNHVAAPLNYRCAVGLAGLSARHLPADRLIEPSVEEYEPVFTLNVYSSRRHRINVVTLWPNGDFIIDADPMNLKSIYATYTWFRECWAAGRRMWTLPMNDTDLHTKWCNLDEKDWQKPRLYVPYSCFVPNSGYRLEADSLGRWKFVAHDPVGTAARLLAEGYGEAERRYARYQRASERANPVPIRDKLALRTPLRVTGEAAVREFATHMRVYPRTKP